MKCTNGNWNVGAITSSDIAGYRFEPFRLLRGWDKVLRPSCYGKLFKTHEEMDAYALEHGFTQVYHHRPNAFITLRVSPASRRYLASLPNHKARWGALLVMLGKERIGSYVRTLLTASYMKERREAMEAYMLTGADPSNDPRRRTYRKARIARPAQK